MTKPAITVTPDDGRGINRIELPDPKDSVCGFHKRKGMGSMAAGLYLAIERIHELEQQAADRKNALHNANAYTKKVVRQRDMLEDERDRMRGQNVALQTKCADDIDVYERSNKELREERDALAAYVERYRRGLYLVDGWAQCDAEGHSGDAREWLNQLRNWASESEFDVEPRTSLDQRDARMKLLALERYVACLANSEDRAYLMSRHLQEYRQQVEGQDHDLL